MPKLGEAEEERQGIVNASESAQHGPQDALARSGVTEEELSSWNFHILDLDVQRQMLVAEGFLEVGAALAIANDCDGALASSGSSLTVDSRKVHTFVHRVCAGYHPTNSYHNFQHGIDVTFAVRRFLMLMQECKMYSSLERYALQVAALGHDIGHIGYNNGYLTATMHPWAILYNDKSPLENMHCAKLFDILASSDADVLSFAPKAQIKQAYELIVDSILHTDNAKHNPMVDELKVIHSDNASTFAEKWPSEEACSLLIENKRLVTNTLLHMADMSNPCKPFRIAKQWADLLLEEFLAQGDMEKLHGLPVQFDRDKVSRPLSQIGFIEFVLAPFHGVVLRMLPCWHETGQHLQETVERWEQIWLEEAQADEAEKEKVRGRVAKVVGMLPSAAASSSTSSTLAPPPPRAKPQPALASMPAEQKEEPAPPTSGERTVSSLYELLPDASDAEKARGRVTQVAGMLPSPGSSTTTATPPTRTRTLIGSSSSSTLAAKIQPGGQVKSSQRLTVNRSLSPPSVALTALSSQPSQPAAAAPGRVLLRSEPVPCTTPAASGAVRILHSGRVAWDPTTDGKTVGTAGTISTTSCSPSSSSSAPADRSLFPAAPAPEREFVSAVGMEQWTCPSNPTRVARTRSPGSGPPMSARILTRPQVSNNGSFLLASPSGTKLSHAPQRNQRWAGHSASVPPLVNQVAAASSFSRHTARRVS